MNKNNKLLIIIMSLGLLSACAEKDQYEQAVLEQLKEDQDIKDYKIDPKRMADCVVDSTSRNMPGFFPVDPERKKAYLAYTKMITVTKSKDPQKVMAELRTEFGSAQELSIAHSNYTESMLGCQTGLIAQNEEMALAAETKDNAATIEKPVTAAPEQPMAPADNVVQAPVNTSTEAVTPQAQPK